MNGLEGHHVDTDLPRDLEALIRRDSHFLVGSFLIPFEYLINILEFV